MEEVRDGLLGWGSGGRLRLGQMNLSGQAGGGEFRRHKEGKVCGPGKGSGVPGDGKVFSGWRFVHLPC